MFLWFSSVVSIDSSAQIRVIKTYAGNDTAGYTGDGGPATAAQCMNPSGIAIDANGEIYFCDQNASCVRKVDAAGIITTVAGTGMLGYSGDGGPATAADLYWPQGITIDHNGNLYISDQFNNLIRRVEPSSGIINTIAGNSSTIGYSGDGGPATDAALWRPTDVAVDGFANVYFADQNNNAVRRVDAVTGIISTIAGTGAAGYNGDGIAADTALLNFPSGLAVDTSGNVFVADFYNDRVRKIDAVTGIITTVAGNGIAGYGSDGGLADTSMLFNPSALSIDKAGDLYICDYNNARIRKVDMATGIISTVAGSGLPGYSGDGGPATDGQIYWPQGVTTDTAGNIYIADYQNHRVRMVTDSTLPDTSTTWVAQNVATAFAVSIVPNPTAGKFVLKVSGNSEPCVAEVRDIMGKCVWKGKLLAGSTVIDLGKPPAGVYTVYATTGAVRRVRRLIVR